MKTLTNCTTCHYGFFAEDGHDCGVKDLMEERIARVFKNKKHLQKESKFCPLCKSEFTPWGNQAYCTQECQDWIYRKRPTGDKLTRKTTPEGV